LHLSMNRRRRTGLADRGVAMDVADRVQGWSGWSAGGRKAWSDIMHEQHPQQGKRVSCLENSAKPRSYRKGHVMAVKF
jgi:hypothetical protein